MINEQEIELEAVSLPIGHSRRIVCPECNGGSTREKSFSITRTEYGIRYNCFRDSCPTAGAVRSTGVHLISASPAPVVQEHTYYGEFRPLQGIDIEYFYNRFHLTVDQKGVIGVNELNQYVFRVLNADGLQVGHNVRYKPWTGEPAYPRSVPTPMSPNGKSKLYIPDQSLPVLSVHRPKTLVLYSLETPEDVKPGGIVWMNSDARIGVITPPYGYGTFVIVEDQISALKVAQAGMTGIALLGVGLDMNKVRYIQRMAPKEVVFALDNDATKTAFHLARDWGLAFPKVRVVLLDKDLKDLPADEILPTLQVAA